MARITKSKGKIKDTDIKRLYLPFVVKDKCPKCGKEVSEDLNTNYLSYPSFNKTHYITMAHEEWDDDGNEVCYEEWEIPVVIDVSLKIQETNEDD